jgi:hypothetical protein
MATKSRVLWVVKSWFVSGSARGGGHKRSFKQCARGAVFLQRIVGPLTITTATPPPTTPRKPSQSIRTHHPPPTIPNHHHHPRTLPPTAARSCPPYTSPAAACTESWCAGVSSRGGVMGVVFVG